MPQLQVSCTLVHSYLVNPPAQIPGPTPLTFSMQAYDSSLPRVPPTLGTNCTFLSILCSLLLRIPRGPDKLGCLQVPQLNTPPTTMVAVLSRSFTQGTPQLTSVWGSPLVSKIQTQSPHPSYPIHHQTLYGLYLYYPEQVQSSYSFPGGSPQTKSRHCPPELCSVHMEATVVCPMQTLLIHRSPPALLSITFLPARCHCNNTRTSS